jgi:hypothetical protein
MSESTRKEEFQSVLERQVQSCVDTVIGESKTSTRYKDRISKAPRIEIPTHLFKREIVETKINVPGPERIVAREVTVEKKVKVLDYKLATTIGIVCLLSGIVLGSVFL